MTNDPRGLGATTRARSAERPARLSDRTVLGLLVAILVAYGLALGLSQYPLELWDESRQAVNAEEMRRTGLSLVTTYGFRPDLWNTKPPLMVWLIVGSFRLFGTSMLALRLPAILASMATVAVVARFVWRATRRAGTALLAAVLLMASSLSFGPHTGMTADFDALLTLALTVSSLAFFRAVHLPPSAARRHWLAFGFALGVAILTKGIAGLLTLPGLFAYLLVVRRAGRSFRSPALWGAAAILLGLVLGFYLTRERIGPGYLAAVMGNEVSGRYGSALEGHRGPPWFYLVVLARGGFSLGPLFLLAPFLLRGAAPRVRALGRFATVVALTMLLIYSAASTKLPWYVTPVVPLLSIVCALAIDRTVRRFEGSRARPAVVGLVASLVLATLARSAYLLAKFDNRRIMLQNSRQGNSYNALFDRLRTLGAAHVTVVDPLYAPQYRFLALTRDTPERTTDLVTGLDAVPPGAGRIVATCDIYLFDALRGRGRVIDATPNYTIVRTDR